MNVITIDTIDDVMFLSKYYKEGKIKLNITKTAKKLGVSLKTLSKRVNGFIPKKNT